MLRALVLSIALLSLSPRLFAAETAPPSVNCNDPGNKPPAPHAGSAAVASSEEDTAAEYELLQAANQSRDLAGVPPLRMEESLREAARAHGRRMVEREQLEHQFSDELSLLERIARASPLKMDHVGENIAYASCAPRANEALMRSAPHRQNLLNASFNIAGIAAFWSKGKLYVVQDFAHEVPSYSAQQSRRLVGQAVAEARQQASLPELIQFKPPRLDEASCSLASQNRPNAHLLATAYDDRKIITYTQSRPEILPPGALRLLRDPGVRQFAVGSCYARNSAYPTGMYWVAILLY
jgi:uncharacterized protein YkwD